MLITIIMELLFPKPLLKKVELKSVVPTYAQWHELIEQAKESGFTPGTICIKKNTNKNNVYGWIILLEFNRAPSEDYKIVRGREYGKIEDFSMDELEIITKSCLDG